ncbi:MAG: hypothetical protein ABS86_01940 [Sphingobium sp. SCN 64-10]|nr:MAG: hypothetical protein ABS86_01940 [Sphingobium sp. SCN 64-10]
MNDADPDVVAENDPELHSVFVAYLPNAIEFRAIGRVSQITPITFDLDNRPGSIAPQKLNIGGILLLAVGAIELKPHRLGHHANDVEFDLGAKKKIPLSNAFPMQKSPRFAAREPAIFVA